MSRIFLKKLLYKILLFTLTISKQVCLTLEDLLSAYCDRCRTGCQKCGREQTELGSCHQETQRTKDNDVWGLRWIWGRYGNNNKHAKWPRWALYLEAYIKCMISDSVSEKASPQEATLKLKAEGYM